MMKLENALTRSIWAVAVGAAALSVAFGGSAVAIEPSDVAGHWDGAVEGEELFEPISIMTWMWLEDGQIRGITGCEYGVSHFDSIVLTDDELAVTFYYQHLGPAALLGSVSPDGKYEFRWSVADMTGTGALAKVRQEPDDVISLEDMAGEYRGRVDGPLLFEAYDVHLDLRVESGSILGRIYTPEGSSDITQSEFEDNRFWLKFESFDEDFVGLAIGWFDGKRMEVYWDVGLSAGRAVLEPIEAWGESGGDDIEPINGDDSVSD